jgi:hypothetical protein
MKTDRKDGCRLARRNRMGLLKGRFILLVLGIYCSAVTYSQPRQDYFVHAETLQPITYLIPDFAVLSDVSIEPNQDRYHISLTMEANLPPNLSDRGRMMMEVWFRHIDSPPLGYDRAVVYAASTLEYPSDPRLLSGQAGLIEWKRDENEAVKLASINVQVVGNQVHLQVPSGLLSGYEPILAVVRYLPSDVNLVHVGGDSGCVQAPLDCLMTG